MGDVNRSLKLVHDNPHPQANPAARKPQLFGVKGGLTEQFYSVVNEDNSVTKHPFASRRSDLSYKK